MCLGQPSALNPQTLRLSFARDQCREFVTLFLRGPNYFSRRCSCGLESAAPLYVISGSVGPVVLVMTNSIQHYGVWGVAVFDLHEV